MTKIIIKKRKTLSLSKPSSPEPEEKKQSREELDKIEQAIKNQRYNDCKEWVLATWPEIFDKANVKPLSLGIHRDIAIAHREAGGFEVLGFGAAIPVKRFLSTWVKRKAYQRALSAPGAKRFNLSGEAVSEVSPSDQQMALESLEKAKKKNRKPKQGEE